jgi:hypothetical protein
MLSKEGPMRRKRYSALVRDCLPGCYLRYKTAYPICENFTSTSWFLDSSG